MKLTVAVVACFFASAQFAVAAPEGAEVTLELDKDEYFLGENVILHWRIRNAGDEYLKFTVGGDGRTPGAGRAVRFKVEAVDAAGNAAPDPYPNPMSFGGFGSEPMLEPGQEFWEDLSLMRYREFTHPGAYTIRVYHDLGWETQAEPIAKDADSSDIPPGPRQAPVATATIRIAVPDAEQARRVVETMLELPDDPNRSVGQRGKPYADFELLRYPIYLPVMKELAQKGDPRGLEAIGAMAFPEATSALLELMEHKDPIIAAEAGELVVDRAPHIFIDGDLTSHHKYMVERSWTDELKKGALAPAWKLLAKHDREGIIRGARLVQSLGNKDDLPALIEVMDRVLVEFKDNPIEQQSYLRPATASEQLASASWALIKHGAEPSVSAATPGRAVALLQGINGNESFRPEGWRDTVRGLITHDIPFIRDMALRNMPLPLENVAVADVAQAIKDDFAPVQGAACELAGKAKLEAFRQPLVDVLQGTQNDWVLRAAFDAAAKCGVDNDRRLEICVRRLGPRTNDMNMLLLSLLINGVIDHQGGYGSSAIADWTSILPGIETAWLEFIDSNRQAIRDGKRFKIAETPVTAAMFPPGFQFHRKDQSAWPAPPPPPPAQLEADEQQSFQFMKDGVVGRLKEWQRTQPKTAAELEKYATELVIHLDHPQFVLNDHTDRIRTAGLSPSFKWTLYRITPDGVETLKAPVRLKLRGLASQPNLCKEIFLLQGTLGGSERGVFVDITTRNLTFHPGRGIADLTSYRFPEEKYAPTADSIDQSLLIRPQPKSK